MKKLFKELKNIKYDKLILVVGFSDDKDIKTISKIIKTKADKIIITKSNNERAEEPEIIVKHFNKNSIIINNPNNALKYAKKITSNEDLKMKVDDLEDAMKNLKMKNKSLITQLSNNKSSKKKNIKYIDVTAPTVIQQL